MAPAWLSKYIVPELACFLIFKRGASGNFDSSNEESYKRRQDEIVKKIQSNIKRSEELDILAAQRKIKYNENKIEKAAVINA